MIINTNSYLVQVSITAFIGKTSFFGCNIYAAPTFNENIK